jgi:hypothetical protein
MQVIILAISTGKPSLMLSMVRLPLLLSLGFLLLLNLFFLDGLVLVIANKVADRIAESQIAANIAANESAAAYHNEAETPVK